MRELNVRKLKKVIKEELRNVLSENEKDLKEIAYDFSRKMGLRKAYLGAFISFDGTWKELDVSVEYNGSHNSLKVYFSPKFNPPGDSNVLVADFESPEDFVIRKKSGNQIDSYSYRSADDFLNKIERVANKNFNRD